MIAAFLLLSAPVFSQDQPPGSLADAARQVRAQKQGQSATGNQAQKLANELSEDQNNTKPRPAQSKNDATQTAGADAAKPAASADASNPAPTGAPKSPDAAANSATAPAAAPAAPASVAKQSAVPAGFKAQRFNYCKGPLQCWDGSVLVPADAKLVSSDCKQYIFETKVQGEPFLLLAGQGGSDACANRSKSDASQVRWDELAEPESGRAPGTYNLIGSQQTTLDGKPAVLVQIGFRKGLTRWMGKRAEIENNGVPLVVGCIAPQDHFADGEAICSKWIESLRLP
jgi:hypothetical protein